MNERIAEAVGESRDRVLAADPECYPGFALDAAIRAVAARERLNWRVVVKAYREHYPASPMNWRRFSEGRQPVPAAREVA